MPVVVVTVVAEGERRPPRGAPIRVEVRDTGLADAPAETLAVATAKVSGPGEDPLATVELAVEAGPGHRTVWALVDVDGDGRTSEGDFVTTRAYPVGPGDEVRVEVTVRAV